MSKKIRVNDVMNHEVLKPAAAAEVAGVSRATIYNWLNSGKIPAIDFSGTVVINRHDLEKYLEVRAAYLGGAAIPGQVEK